MAHPSAIRAGTDVSFRLLFAVYVQIQVLFVQIHLHVGAAQVGGALLAGAGLAVGGFALAGGAFLNGIQDVFFQRLGVYTLVGDGCFHLHMVAGGSDKLGGGGFLDGVDAGRPR